MKAWSHLPNSHHIDWVLASSNKNPELWNAARNAAWDAARNAARSEAWDAARSEAWVAAWDAAGDAVWDAAWAAIGALIAYDDCDQFLNMTYEKLQVWAVLSEDPRAILLLPMVYVKEKLNEQSLVAPA